MGGACGTHERREQYVVLEGKIPLGRQGHGYGIRIDLWEIGTWGWLRIGTGDGLLSTR